MSDVAHSVAWTDGVPAGHWAAAAEQREGPAWLRWAGPVLSVAIIAAVVNAVGARDLVVLWRTMPRAPGFWLLLGLFLAVPPVADFMIFRGLWRLPWTGLVALFRKATINQLVLGYTGELQFYVWARRHAALPGSPFGAVRDVAVLSAVVGNVATIALLLIARPLLGTATLNPLGPPLIWAAITLIASSTLVILFRRRLFALSRAQFWRIASIHLLRTILGALLLVILWSSIQPGVAFHWWIVLLAGRQLVTRLPFLPNKDLVFAGLAAQVLNGDPDLTGTIVLVATLGAAGQVLIGGILAIIDLAREVPSRTSSR